MSIRERITMSSPDRIDIHVYPKDSLMSIQNKIMHIELKSIYIISYRGIIYHKKTTTA